MPILPVVTIKPCPHPVPVPVPVPVPTNHESIYGHRMQFQATWNNHMELALISSPYEILNVPMDATERDVRRATPKPTSGIQTNIPSPAATRPISACNC